MRSLLALTVLWAMLSGCGGKASLNDNLNENAAPPAPEIRIGFGDPFVPIEDGGVFLVGRGFQGLIDTAPIIRLLNFPADTTVRLSIRMTLLELDRVVMDETQELSFTEIAPGINQLDAILVIGESPSVAFGKEAQLVLSADTVTGEPTSAALELTVVLTEGQ